MPLPLVPIVIGSGLAALIFAGKSEKPQSSTSSAGPATPTQQSTAGASGGATNPAHADLGEATPATSSSSSSPTPTPTPPPPEPGTSAGYAGGAISGVVGALGAATGSIGGAIETGQEAAFTPQPKPGAAQTQVDLVGYTSKFLGDTFKTSADFFGQIW